MSNTTPHGFIRVSFRLLAELLQLPEGALITHVEGEPGDIGVRIYLRGEKLPEVEDGKPSPLVKLVVYRETSFSTFERDDRGRDHLDNPLDPEAHPPRRPQAPPPQPTLGSRRG